MTFSNGYGPPGAAEREKMIESHLSLVDFLVDRMMTQVPAFVSRDDIRSAALMGLMDASNRFDPRRGVLFKTFAERRIRGAVFDEVRRMDWFSRTLREKQSRLSKVTDSLGKQLGRIPEDTEVAEELDMTLDDFRELQLQVSQLGTISLHESVDDDDSGKTFIDNLEDTQQASVQERMEANELTGELAGYLEQLSEKERLVVALIYYEELSQKEISEVLELSEGRISQLHSQALGKLKIKMKRSINALHTEDR
ncbi:RNA polymerase, sigma 28 subunit, SigD/FliA/WhiG [Desulfuromusa kysingii]|uniref:RNA polymerase, sigma 28 subunit, SigD/FliA/WhiG n=1 Tax=Desulfuromusa kysingii TaxID=37625 RepID=A0A1H3VI98_9BACT|nr:FliA/WhiG family RNA polymerase sigma factor [Desulfuromusa kysingii]SDZ73888.1 RNA polymerase, sigma 28 subunit, SigD/FliA/WhiG [Desulfuromusa kysingii]